MAAEGPVFLSHRSETFLQAWCLTPTLTHRWNRNPRPQPRKCIKLVFLKKFSESCICLNRLSGALVGVGFRFHRSTYLRPQTSIKQNTKHKQTRDRQTATFCLRPLGRPRRPVASAGQGRSPASPSQPRDIQRTMYGALRIHSWHSPKRPPFCEKLCYHSLNPF